MESGILSCPSKTAKYFLFFFNIIFWIAGGVVLSTGIWALADHNASKILHIAIIDGNGKLLEAAGITLIVVGTVVLLTGFLGCCGAFAKSPSMLCLYAFLMGFVLSLQLIAGILALSFRQEIRTNLVDSLNTTVQERYGVDEGATEGLDDMQRMLRCCGARDGPEEWQSSIWRQNSTSSVPVTCCVLKNQEKLNEKPEPVDAALCDQYGENMPADKTEASKYIFIQGCEPGLNDWIYQNAGRVIGVAFGFGAIQLVGVIMACCLRKSINNSYKYL